MSPAERAIAAFGGVGPLAKAVNRDVSRVHRWTYPKARGGCDGRIPGDLLGVILAKARNQGLDLSAEDLIGGPKPKRAA